MIFDMDCVSEINSSDLIRLKTKSFDILRISNSIQVVLEGRQS